MANHRSELARQRAGSEQYPDAGVTWREGYAVETYRAYPDRRGHRVNVRNAAGEFVGGTWVGTQRQIHDVVERLFATAVAGRTADQQLRDLDLARQVGRAA